MKIRNILFMILLLLFACNRTSTDDTIPVVMPVKELTKQEKYIEKYKALAIKEMKLHGIPASITLAQGMFESGYGESMLAVKANNHFGIKCHGWKIDVIYHDDDKKGECFRRYKTVEESYADHSKILLHKRYKALFELELTDYKGWAKGLKKAGYATSSTYADRLIGMIEKYNLQSLDNEIFKKNK